MQCYEKQTAFKQLYSFLSVFPKKSPLDTIETSKSLIFLYCGILKKFKLSSTSETSFNFATNFIYPEIMKYIMSF